MKMAVKAIIATAILAVAVYSIHHDSTPAGTLDDFESWPPDSAEKIKRTLDADPSTALPAGEAARRQKFGKIFESRFRGHDPQMAIGLRFTGPNLLKLMCPARMEPCNLDRIAMSTWSQSRDVFGHNVDIDIYETYIGSPPRKIGELRAQKDKPDVQQITYITHPTKVIIRQLGMR